MDNILDEYKLYWETNMLLRNEEFESGWGLDEALSEPYDSSSPNGSGVLSSSSSSVTKSKNIDSERNRRKTLNERLFALRSLVPNISKLDKASIIKDAISYIQELQKEEKRIQAEITEFECSKSEKNSTDWMFENHDEGHKEALLLPSNGAVRPKKKRTANRDSPVEDIELTVSFMGHKMVAVSLTCSKKRDTMVKLCEVFESLGLKIITANITALSGTLLITFLIEVDSEEMDSVKFKIEAAIATLRDPADSPLNM